jgi:hypothetical protein
VTKGKADNLATRYPRYPSTSSKAFFIQGSKTVPAPAKDMVGASGEFQGSEALLVKPSQSRIHSAKVFDKR